MNGKRFCPKCGKANEMNFNFCDGCGTPLVQTNVNNNQPSVSNNQQSINSQQVIDDEQKQIDEHNAIILGIVSLVLYYVGGAIVLVISSLLPESARTFFSSFSGLCPLAGVITMIVGRIKYPKNTFLKVVMWIIIISIMFGIIAIILLFLMCYLTCSTMDTSSCG